MKTNTGLSSQHRKKVSKQLGHLLADTYTLYLKTHNFHWNVTGPMFSTLHLLFEEEYTELATAVDIIAERIRALGEPAPGSYKEFLKLTTIKEAQGKPNATQMIKQLEKDQEAVIKTARRALTEAVKAGDDVSVDLLTNRLNVHEKNTWMLSSLLEN